MLGLLGLAADSRHPVMVDFARQHVFTVTGPGGSGRSTVLETFARSLLAAGTGLVVIAPRESPLRQIGNGQHTRLFTAATVTSTELSEAVTSVGAPGVVLIDDADVLSQLPPADQALRDVITYGREQGVGLACAGSAEVFVTAMIGWMNEARRIRQGVLLHPQTAGEGDLLGVRLPLDILRRPRRLGRGYVTDRSTGVLMPVALPESTIWG
jgi:S-DNA-T family DNA segregation ATPase FtsK/SpoIIIE